MTAVGETRAALVICSPCSTSGHLDFFGAVDMQVGRNDVEARVDHVLMALRTFHVFIIDVFLMLTRHARAVGSLGRMAGVAGQRACRGPCFRAVVLSPVAMAVEVVAGSPAITCSGIE